MNFSNNTFGSLRSFFSNSKKIFYNLKRLVLLVPIIFVAQVSYVSGATATNENAGAIKGRVLRTQTGNTVTTSGVASGSSPQTSSVPVGGAKLTLVSKTAPGQPRSTVSNASGDFLFENLAPGIYVLTIQAEGLSTVTKEIDLTTDAMLDVEIDLTAAISESVVVRGDEGIINTTDTTTSNVVTAEKLKDQPLRTDNFQNAIQLTPGTVTGGNGANYVKGTRPGQSGYTVNGADVTDPVTGNLAFDIPLEAAQSVQIEDNPYSAQLGKFTGGVTNLQTKGGTDKFKISAARFFPTLHNIFSAQIDSFRPRVTFSGPIVKNKLYFLQAFEYRYSRIFVPSQKTPNDSIVQEGFNSFTQLDWNISKNNVLKFNAAFFPNKYRNLGLDTFNPAPATPNYKQRGELISVSEQSVFKNASFLSSQISYKTFDLDVTPKSNQAFVVTPDTASGGYFAESHRRTRRVQWQETYYSRSLKFFGDQSLIVGTEIDHTKVGGQLRYSSVYVRREDGTLAQKIEYTTSSPLDFGYNEIAAFAQDRWIINPRLTLDLGLRFDRDSVTENNNLAPRFSFLYLPFADGKTTLRGGVGIFYDRPPATAGDVDGVLVEDDAGATNPSAEFDQIPRRTVMNYAADGVTMTTARFFRNQIQSPLLTPRSIRYSLQIDRRLMKYLDVRASFLERFTKNDLLLYPLARTLSSDVLRLSSTGRAHYDELQFLLSYHNEKFGQWSASYVLSHASGDLNTANQFLDNTPAFAIKSNQYGRLPFDAPHHFLLFGQKDVSKKYDIRVAPLFEMRSGFPFSAVNERLTFIGKRNAAGSFPTYLSLDVQVSKGFNIPYFDKRARVGIILFNLTNHFNPRDVQMNVTSSNYGKFYNSLGTSVKAKLELNF